MGALGPQSPQGPPPPTVLGPHKANPPDIRIDVQDTIAGYIAKCRGVKAAPPARAAAKGAAPAKGEPHMCLVVVMSRKDAPHDRPNLIRHLVLQENEPQANPTLVNPIH